MAPGEVSRGWKGCYVLPLTLPNPHTHTEQHTGVCCVVHRTQTVQRALHREDAVSVCLKLGCSAVQGQTNATCKTFIKTCMQARVCNLVPYSTVHTHSHAVVKKYQNWDAQQREELAGPLANLMHGDHFQNRTKWWAISRWQSGSRQGPRGEMACNCVRVPAE